MSATPDRSLFFLLEDLDHLPHCGSHSAGAAADDPEGTPDEFPLDRNLNEGSAFNLGFHALARDDGNRVLDEDAAFHGFDIVELDDFFHADSGVREHAVNRLSRRQIGLERNKSLTIDVTQ